LRAFILICDAGYIENALYRGQKTTKKERDYLLRIVTAVQNGIRQSDGENA